MVIGQVNYIGRTFNSKITAIIKLSLACTSLPPKSLRKSQQNHCDHHVGITPKRVTSDGAHLRHYASGQRSFEEALQLWRAVGDTVPDLTGRETESKTFCDVAVSLTTTSTDDHFNDDKCRVKQKRLVLETTEVFFS